MMITPNVSIIEKSSYDLDQFSFDIMNVDLTYNHPLHTRIGVDPGTTNLGIALLHSGFPTIFQVKITRDKDPIKRILLFQRIMDRCISYLFGDVTMIIEGAGYQSSQYRQVELGECRASIALWALQRNYSVRIVAPNSIRKSVFGNGRTKAQDVWKNLPPDAATALSCCFY